MPQPTSPLAARKARFSSKAELIAAVAPKLEPAPGETADALRSRLKSVANRKLLRLLALTEELERRGGRAPVIARIAELKGQSKDHPFLEHLKKLPMGQLVDLVRSLERTAKAKRRS